MNPPARSLRLAFAGTPQFAVPALDSLAASRHRLVGVFTRPDKPRGRGQTLQVSAVKQRAAAIGIAVQQPASFRDPAALQALRQMNCDVFVVVAYGCLLPADALAIPAIACLNIHASLLPRWRGAAPIQRALLAGDAQTGVTIMRMDAGLDTGPMLERRAIDVAATDNSQSLHERLAVLGGELILAALDALADGRQREEPQPPCGATYAPKVDKSEASIDWRADAPQIARAVRAFNPWPVAETRWNSQQLRIWEAAALAPASGSPLPPPASPPGTVLDASAAGIDVACGAGVLRISRLQLPGRKPVGVREFVNAHALAATRFGSP